MKGKEQNSEMVTRGKEKQSRTKCPGKDYRSAWYLQKEVTFIDDSVGVRYTIKCIMEICSLMQQTCNLSAIITPTLQKKLNPRKVK